MAPEGLAAVPVGGGGAWPGFEATRRAELAARTAEAGGTDTTASQISHAIRLGEVSIKSENVAIPTI